MPPTKITPLAKELTKQLHPTLNVVVDPTLIGAKSSTKLWWKCTAHDHPYLATPAHKTAGAGCSVCAGKQIHVGFNDLATTHPEVAKLWHPTKNEGVSASQVTKGSSKKAWWQCQLGHEIHSTPANMRATTCGTCSGRVILKGFNDAKTLKPKLEKYFNVEKNGVAYDEIGGGYSTKIFWNNKCGHEAEALLSNCTENSIPCLYCSNKKILIGFNDVATTNPELEAIWHSDKNNGLSLQEFNKGSKTLLWWKCEEGHEWQGRTGNQIVKKDLCSYCAGTLIIPGVNDLMTLKPELMDEWNHARNVGIDTDSIAPYSSAKYWWKCDKGHEWDSACTNRFRGTGCPYCSGNKTEKGINSLGDKFPEVAEEWDYEKNGDVSPFDVAAMSSKMVFWKCKEGHSWQAKIIGRTRSGHSCLKCSKIKMPKNSQSLANKHPELSNQWNTMKNKTFTPSTVSEKSNRLAWWICDKNHEWESAISNRTDKNSGCPICWQSAINSNAENELAQFIESLGFKVERNNRKLLQSGKELDIYIPELKFALEYNGLFWHSEERGKGSNYHANKMEECALQGIKLIMIWEDDWINRKAIIQKNLTRNLSYESTSMSQRLESYKASNGFVGQIISKLDFKVAQDFLRGNHIKGGTRSDHFFGLHSEGVLQSVISMKEIGKNKEYLIERYTTNLVDDESLSRLLNYASAVLKARKYVIFDDLSFSEEYIYRLAGFTKESQLPPDYSYIVSKKREPKSNYPEGELLKMNGLQRIWDCGRAKYIKEIITP